MLSSHICDTVSLVFIGSYPIMSSCYSLIYLLREPQSGRIIDCPVIWQSVERSTDDWIWTNTSRPRKPGLLPITPRLHKMDEAGLEPCDPNTSDTELYSPSFFVHGESLWDLHSLRWSFINLDFRPSNRKDVTGQTTFTVLSAQVDSCPGGFSPLYFVKPHLWWLGIYTYTSHSSLSGELDLNQRQDIE